MTDIIDPRGRTLRKVEYEVSGGGVATVEGSLVISDSPGKIVANVLDQETLTTVTEENLLSAEVLSSETNANWLETQEFFAQMSSDELQTSLLDVEYIELLAQNSETLPIYTDASGSLDAQVQYSETLLSHSEASLTDISIGGQEFLSGHLEVGQSELSVSASETLASKSDLESLELNLTYSEGLSVHSETSTMEASTSTSEIQTIPDESYSLETIVVESIGIKTDVPGVLDAIVFNDEELSSQNEGILDLIVSGFGESKTVPLEDDQAEVSVGSTSAVSTNITGGAGWVNPANANGLANDTVSTLTSASGVTPARQTANLTGTYATLGTMASETRPTTIDITFRVALNLAPLTTGSLEMAVSENAGSTWTVLQTLTATTTLSDYLFTLAFDPANLSSLRYRVQGNVIGAVTAASSASVDAVVVQFTTT